jgi:hypothetical protein
MGKSRGVSLWLHGVWEDCVCGFYYVSVWWGIEGDLWNMCEECMMLLVKPLGSGDCCLCGGL